MYVLQAPHVLDGVLRGLPPMTSIAQAQRVLEVQLAIRATWQG